MFCPIAALIPLNAVSEEECRFPPIVEGMHFVAGMGPSGHVAAVGSYKDSADARPAADMVVRSTG